MGIHELYGRQAEQFNELLEAWNGVLQIVRDIRDGRVLPSQLVVNENGVEVRPVELATSSADYYTQDAASG